VTIFRLRRSAAAWLALTAMALNAAWPLLANAKPFDPSSEICSASGLEHAGGGAPGVPGKGLHASHCSLCPFGAERCATIPLAITPPPVPVAVPAQAFARGDAPQVRFALHPSAPPRAPPVLS
jgi:hypothetical protein